MTPIPRTGTAKPEDYILPIKKDHNGVLVEWWQWVPPLSGSSAGYWAHITCYGV